jgi:hypothetical protein
MPHKLEVATTARARCRGCKEAIAKGEVRFGEEFKNPYSEDGGMSYRYWHLRCAAQKLANDLRPALAAYEGDVPDKAEIEALIVQHLKPEMPFAERAPNARAKCRACEQAIVKGALRVAFERMFEGPMGTQKGAAYCHVACLSRFLEREAEQGRTPPTAAELLRTLEAHGPVAPGDQAELREALGG